MNYILNVHFDEQKIAFRKKRNAISADGLAAEDHKGERRVHSVAWNMPLTKL